MKFHNLRLVVACVISTVISLASSGFSDDKIKALIIDGQNNHAAWPKTTAMMKKYLEDTGKFTVDVARTKFTWQGDDLLKDFQVNDGKEHIAEKQPKPDPDFKPKFQDYQVVISNFGFGAAPWPAETNESFERYVSGGGGFVVIHAADNSFGSWNEYNRMIGLGGWENRNEKSGPYVYVDADGKTIRDTAAGTGGSHGAQHEFAVVVRDAEHPITRGLPKSFVHTQDELYDRLRGPAENMKILATAFSSKGKGGTDRNEPMIMTIDYGKGRVFHTPMGHGDISMECVGFITVFIRGTEWAATGKVSLDKVPSDFPSADQSSKRTFAK